MRQRILLLLAVVFGLLAFILTYQQIESEKRRISGDSETVILIQVTRNMVEGETLTEKDVKDFLLRIQTNKEYSLFVQDKFARFFGTWLEDVSRKKVWRYFTEHDWEKEYERHSFIN